MRSLITPILSEAPSESAVSKFQHSFFEAWDFFFPNIVMLGLVFFITRYVGGVEWSFAKKILSKGRNSIASIAELLRSSELPGAKLLPLGALLISIVMAINVFQLVRNVSVNLLPPAVIVKYSPSYEPLIHESLMIRILLSPAPISSRWDIYKQVQDWGVRALNDKETPGSYNVKYWNKKSGDWHSSIGDVKLLAFVTLFSLIMGLRKKKQCLARFIVVFLFLCVSFAFCLGKFLYATEQQRMAEVSSFERYLSDSGKQDWDLFLKNGAENLNNNKSWLTSDQPRSGRWWELRWWDSHFYSRFWNAFWSPNEMIPAVLSESELEDLEKRIQEGLRPASPASPSTD